MKNYHFTIVIGKDEDGRYLVICPALQGCYTEGETEEEAHRLIKDAIKLHVESRQERGEPIYEEVAVEKTRQAWINHGKTITLLLTPPPAVLLDGSGGLL